jgi:adenosylcobinamide-GDP ribazoletransferase
MADTSSIVERLWQDFCAAVGFLTVLPLMPLAADRSSSLPAPDRPVAEEDDAAAAGFGETVRASGFLARAAGLFPLVGAAIGTIAALALLAAFHIGLHPLACALLAFAAAAAVTGALHEDGLADFFDGLGGGRSPEERLAIMRDSRLGSYGALALIFAVGLRAAILTGLFSPDTAALGIIAGAAISRGTLPGVMRWLPPARADGLAVAAGQPEPTQIALAALIALVVALLTVGFWAAMSALTAAILAAALVALLARWRLGGQTGDVLGAVQVISEIAVLAAIAATVSVE